MTSIDQLPPERSLPPVRHARLRARVLSAMTAPTPRPRQPVRIAAAGLAVAVCAAIVWIGASGYTGFDARGPEVYALGDSVLSLQARQAGGKCLELVRDERGQPVARPEDPTPVLVNHIEQLGLGGAVIYEVRQSWLVPCFTPPAWSDEPEPPGLNNSSMSALAIYDGTAWLPGPISIELAISSDREGGYVKLAGRVSERVARVVLDDGAGHQSTARLAEGTFVLISEGRIAPHAGTVISYDAGGREIDRRPFLEQPSGRCYTDPAGNLVNPTSYHGFETAYRSDPAHCEPAERWSRRAASATATQPVPR